MFRRISIQLALQFTAYVALLLLITGAIFIVVDFRVSRRAVDDLLTRESQRILEYLPATLQNPSAVLPSWERERVRIVTADGKLVYSGGMIEEMPFDRNATELIDANVNGEQMRVLTTPILLGGQLVGFLQVGSGSPVSPGDLPRRAFMFLLISGCISVLTFIVGLFFARSTLQPAEETMRRLEQFTQDASHELRTPLSILGSSLDLSLKTQKYREGILSAKEDLQRISLLVERLMDLSYLDAQALDLKKMDLSSIAERVVADHAHLAREKCISIASAVEKNITAYGDETLTTQVLGNLLANAIKFTPPGGSIRLSLGKKSIEVTDTGIGIAEEALPSIFDRFYQADGARNGQGFGLGLALVKRIVELHGWRIAVESKEGRGTTFTISFRQMEKQSRKAAALH